MQMTYEAARQLLRQGHRMTRESWNGDFFVESTHTDPTRRLVLQDNTGREHETSTVDRAANDWVVWED